MSRSNKGSQVELGPVKVQEVDDLHDDATTEEHVVTTYMVVPPDGGWGWVVAGASFFSNLVVDGIIFSFGMYLAPISEALGESKATVSIIGSLLTGFYLMAGPFVSALANRYGFRVVAVWGSVLGCVSFVVSYFATSALFLCISYGFFGGVGFGMVYVPAVITVGFYFERWRALATGVAVCGSGIGTFVMPPLITMLVKSYGWRGSLLLLAALVLNCAIFGLMYRPLKPVRVTVDTKEEQTSSETKPSEQLSLLMQIKMTREDQSRNSMSLGSVADNISVTADKPVSNSLILKANNNNMYPTAAQALSESHKASSLSLSLLGPSGAGSSLTKAQKRLSVPLYSDALRRSEEDESTHGTELLKPVDEQEMSSECSKKQEGEKLVLQKRNSRTRTISECSKSSCRSRKGTGSKDVGVRPFYRDDIFFGGSLARLPQYTSQMSSVGYHMSVSHLPTKTDIQEEERAECRLFPEAFQRTLATMLDISLLQSPTFIVLAVSGFITMMGFYVPFMYIADRAKIGGTTDDISVWLVSSIGIANTIGRVGCGVISSFPGADSLLINNVALTIGGVATMMSGLSNSNEFLFTYASVFGLSTACFASLRSIIIVDLLGLDNLTNAFGLLLLFQGIAATIGAPLAGAFMEYTGSYDASFYLSGGLILLSAILCYPLNRVNVWERKRNKVTNGDDV